MERRTTPAEGIAARQRELFSTGVTREIPFRIQQLTALRDAFVRRERDVLGALRNDLGKPEAEAYTSEIAPVLHEIERARRELRSWARPLRS